MVASAELGDLSRLVSISLGHGITIAVLVSNLSGISGGHINPVGRSAARPAEPELLARARSAAEPRRSCLLGLKDRRAQTTRNGHGLVCAFAPSSPSHPPFLVSPVSTSLFLTGHISSLRMVVYIVAQVLGGIAGAGLLWSTTPEDDNHYNLGSHTLNPKLNPGGLGLGGGDRPVWLFLRAAVVAATPTTATATAHAPLLPAVCAFAGQGMVTELMLT